MNAILSLIPIVLMIILIGIVTRPLRRGFPELAQFKRERDILRRARLNRKPPRAMAHQKRRRSVAGPGAIR